MFGVTQQVRKQLHKLQKINLSANKKNHILVERERVRLTDGFNDFIELLQLSHSLFFTFVQ